jgi:predicted dehydrogenase
MASDREIDAVAVCVPPGDHAAAALPALEAGKHVLVEKPLALSLEDCDRLLEASRKAQGRCLMGFHMRWHRLIRSARDLLSRSLIGPLESIRCLWNSPRSDRNIPAWKQRRATGGGALVELCVHSFDLWRFLLGSEVDEVHAYARHGKRDDEAVFVSGRMANGALSSVACSERTSHEIEIEIAGSEGRLRLSCLRFDGLSWYSQASIPGKVSTRLRQLGNFAREFPRGLWEMSRGGDYRGSYRAQWAHFLEVARGRVAPSVTFEDGRRAVEVVLAAAASASSGHPVAVAKAPPCIQG